MMSQKPLVLDFRDPYGVETLFHPWVLSFRITINRAIEDLFVNWSTNSTIDPLRRTFIAESLRPDRRA